MNYYNVFYWLTVADGVKKCFDIFSNIFSTFAVLSFVAYAIISIGRVITVSENDLKNEEDDKKDADLRSWNIGRQFVIRLFYSMTILSVITWMGYVFTPTKKDCLLIVAGGAVGNFITTDSTAKEIPSDITKFLHLSLQEEIKDLDSDVKRELGIQSPKEKLIDKAKEMSKEQLLEYLKSDTVLLK